MNDLGFFQNEIGSLPTLNNTRYENIFKLYSVKKTTDNYYYFYNIQKKIQLPGMISGSYIKTVNVNRDLPWTTLSYIIYGTQDLWWLIVLLSKPDNIFLAQAGTQVTYFLPIVTQEILNSINLQKNL